MNFVAFVTGSDLLSRSVAPTCTPNIVWNYCLFVWIVSKLCFMLPSIYVEVFKKISFIAKRFPWYV